MLEDWINDVIKKYILLKQEDGDLKLIPEWHEIRVLVMTIFLSIPVVVLEKIEVKDCILYKIEEILKKYFVIIDKYDDTICYIDEYWHADYLDDIPICFLKGLAVYSELIPEIEEQNKERSTIFYNFFLLPTIGKFFLLYKKNLNSQEVPSGSSCEFFRYDQILESKTPGRKDFFSKEKINLIIEEYQLYSLKNEFLEKTLFYKYWNLGMSVLDNGKREESNNNEQ